MNTAAIYHRPESEFSFLYTKENLRIRLRTGGADVDQVYLIEGDPFKITTEKWYLKESPLNKTLSTLTHDYWEIELSSETRRSQYGFHIVGRDGLSCFYGDQGIFPYTKAVIQEPNYYFRMPYFQEVDRFKAPSWVKETVWYQIFPERFANGDVTNDPSQTLPWGSQSPQREDFFGGDLQGVLDHLDYLTELGVNGLYFCPLFKAHSNHKYDTIDYLEIDPAFGDKQLFKKLVDQCHQRGIKVMLDAVFNHIGDNSHQWQDVIKHGQKSKYVDWFHIHSFPVTDYQMTDIPETATGLPYDTFAFTPHMPKLNTANPEVQAYLLKIATYWVEEFDIDGWRLDVASEVDHQFWKKFRSAVTAIKADCYILGEIWHSSQNWLQGDEFHAVMNYAFTDNIKDFFITKKLSAQQMISGMNQQQLLYRDQVNEVMFNLLDSHDTARLLTNCQNNQELMRAVLTFMFLQKGSPCIYYGTEIGMTGEGDPDCRKCMIWEEKEQDQELFRFMQKLIGLRKQLNPILASGTLIWLENLAKEQVGFVRRLAEHEIVAYFNESQEELVIEPTGQVIFSQNSQINDKGAWRIQKHGFLISK